MLYTPTVKTSKARGLRSIPTSPMVALMEFFHAESTRDIYNYGKYINQFPLNMIKAIRMDPEENM